MEIPDFRSSELWEDQEFTCIAVNLKPLDLILLHNNDCAWGAHVVVYLGQALVLHLAKQNGVPKIEFLTDIRKNPKYQFYIGAKTVIEPAKVRQ